MKMQKYRFLKEDRQMNNSDAFTRYNMLISLLTYQDLDTSISVLAQSLQVPVIQIRKDLAALFDSVFWKNYISISADYLDSIPGKYRLSEAEFSNPESAGIDYYALRDYFTPDIYDYLQSKINSGDLDTVAFSLYADNTLLDQDHFSLSLSPSERAVLQKIMPDFISPSPIPAFEIKSIFPNIKQDCLRFTAQITNAAACGYGIKLTIRKDEKVHTVSVNPLGIYHNMENNSFYCIDTNGDYYDYSTIISVSNISPVETSNPVTPAALDYIDCLWGRIHSDANNDNAGQTEAASGHLDLSLQPMTVKVLIKENTQNILAKIKADTAYRKFAHIQKAGEGSWIYTDKVIGEAGFRRWLRGFGSSVVVLEPEELARAMKKSALAMKQVYETGEFI